ncbi:exodeoxyribonuclease VII large subunit [Methylocapsa aurea]|uniref:exodeoxyribonuclease VII large subunit n=1 Tax=Methylocapsa aurea TaxID=663610 RepID=UPI00056B70A0|nr:exodeoxyribonuclease VII large subunit [Methylocapsa aurea]
MPDPAASNAPELTVSELSNALKRTIEDRFGFVRLRGEISNYRGPHSSGHAYFCLKDQSARIDAVIWKGVFAKLRTKPQEGLEVIATGKVTTFPGKSSYQIIIEAIEPAGVGALMALLEERRRKLAAEGLFDEARKQLPPFLPACIGVVTSPTGAVIRDILHRIADRFPRHVLVWPVRVQGETSAAEIAAAIGGFNALPEQGPLRRPDVIIVARGGGSLEDLWSFNEEVVVRAAAQSFIPLIAAIGHETDWTLIDHAADLRAPTPSAAAEKAVPVRAELAASLADLGRRHAGATFRLVERRRNELRALLRALPQGDAIVALPRQRLDSASGRLHGALARTHDRQRIGLARLSHRLAQQSPQAKMGRAEEQLKALHQRLRRALATGRERRRQSLDHIGSRLTIARAARVKIECERATASRRRLDALAKRMEHGIFARMEARRAQIRTLAQLLGSLGYGQVLARGFAMVSDGQGKLVTKAAEIVDGALLHIKFSDGQKTAIAGPPKAAAPEKRTSKAPRKRDQGSLF